MSGAAEVVVVLPDGLDDPRRPSGGNRYDRQVCTGLRTLGWSVHETVVPGAWPHPDGAARDALAAALGTAPGTAGGTAVGTGADDPGGRPVVLVDGMLASGAGDIVAATARNRPVVVLVHLPFGSVEPSLAPAERLMLSQVAAVVTTSRWARQYLVDTYRLPADRVHVAPPGADGARADGMDRVTGVGGIPAGGGRLLCVAAVTRLKGLDVLVDALTALAGASRSAGPGERDWRCTCVGALDLEPAFVARLRAAVEEGGLAGRVAFTGPLDRDGLDAAYDAADLLVLPSRTESWGMVVTEALARGVPVVASDVGGVPESLGRGPDGIRPGLLVPPGDPSALADALTCWLTDPELRRRLRTAAAARRAHLPGWDHPAALVSGALSVVLADRAVTVGARRW